MPLTEDLPSTPRISQDEGYGHGVSIDSRIVTPRVPILSEQILMLIQMKFIKTKWMY